MGVRGLKSFIENNNDLLISDYRLHNTSVVIDACNLIGALIKQSQGHERRDLFGGDMVQFGRFISCFFDNLRTCKIEPILVFDGAQTRDANKSKTREKRRRAIERFHSVMNINKIGFGDFILPATASQVFRSIAVDKGVEIRQCMFEADLEIARLAHQFKSPVLSNDSDFYLIDLPFGLTSIDSLEHQKVLVDQYEDGEEYKFIYCSLYKQDHFTKYFPNLDKTNLPLLGILAGNDFIQAKVFENICSQLPIHRASGHYGMTAKQFRKATSKQHEKIMKVLYYLCDKSLNETINQLCIKVPKEQRAYLKKLIKSNLVVYDVPLEDDFEIELSKLYRSGFCATYKREFKNRDQMDLEFKKNLRTINVWLKKSMEQSVLSYRCLELAQRNTIFLQSHMDDPQLPSAHLCQIRFLKVLLALLKSSPSDRKPCFIYDRISNIYGKSIITPMIELEGFGPLNYLIYDIPYLSHEDKKAILLTTFHSSSNQFCQMFFDYQGWFEKAHAEEYLTVIILLKFIIRETKGVGLWKHFCQAVLLCIVYYLYVDKMDSILREQLNEDKEGAEFIDELVSVIWHYKYKKTPTLSHKRLYNSRLMHQITQLQCSIISFNLLNAFLGDIMVRIRSQNWLNSCLIYNLTENLRRKTLRLPPVPSIINLD